MQVLADKEQKRKQRAMAEATKDTHAQQREEHKAKWKDPYGEKTGFQTNQWWVKWDANKSFALIFTCLLILFSITKY